jgi:hypothetical protein
VSAGVAGFFKKHEGRPGELAVLGRMVAVRFGQKLSSAVKLATMTSSLAAISPSHAYLYWSRPDFSGSPVRGDEPGIMLPLPKATPAQIQAGLVWTLRAGLNVAALQCQFAPALMTVSNYNTLLKQHDAEFDKAQAALGLYFKKVAGKNWQREFDTYTTRTYNGFSTLHAQIGFCETAGSIGRDALGRRRGDLHFTAEQKMREFRNSLVPKGDMFFALQPTTVSYRELPLDPKCWNKRGELKSTCPFSY